MTIQNQAENLLAKNNGIFTRKQAVSENINSVVLTRMVNKNLIERVGPGIYIDPASFEDDFKIAQLRFSKGIFYKETALYLYDLTDRTPNYMEMNFPRGYKTDAVKELRIHPHNQIKNLYELGITESVTPYGNTVKVYNIERTLCDILKAPHKAHEEVIQSAFKKYLSRRDKNLNKLMRFAKIFNVDNEVNTYVRILL